MSENFSKELISLFENTMNVGLDRAIFSAPRRKSLEYHRVLVRPVVLKGMLAFQLEYTYDKKVTHENVDEFGIVDRCLKLVGEDFKQVNLFTRSGEIQVLASKPENPRIIKSPGPKLPEPKKGATPLKTRNVGAAAITLEPSDLSGLSHNRTKNYIIPDGQPCDFLMELGVMGADGKVFQKGYRKFRQINRYLEIVADAIGDLGGLEKLKAQTTGADGRIRPFRIIDFGCGKAYLTFAIYYYLKVMNGLDVEIIGLDLKQDVIDFCEGTARRLGYEGLSFLHGDIADYESDGADMVVTLHACDTATDYALANAVRWHSRIILSVPCCQHELFKQIKNSVTAPMFKHGILKERFTEILTDGLRGLKLESRGYEVAMIEFTSLEHTARNIMIKAIMKDPECRGKRCSAALAEYEALCSEYNVKPTTNII